MAVMNKEVKKAIIEAGLTSMDVSRVLGISYQVFINKLNTQELSPDSKSKIYRVINRMKKKEDGIKKCDSYCKGCKYKMRITGFYKNVYACNYIEVVGERRGCPAGSGCNKKVVSDGRRKTNY